ncbi:MAG TPA: glycosyltransferase [Candidatus Limnocylindrales bacterium]|jgi:glycosyltransferase involved in cell wall biosynthesis
MERQPRLAPEPGSFTEESMRALRAMAGADAPLLLAYHPAYLGNPYQALLYGAARESAMAPVRMPRLSQLDELLALQEHGVQTVLHLHWLHAIQQGATSEADARRRAGAFLGRLDAYLAAGGRIAWTVHNILPHETRFERTEIELSDQVASRAEIIHIMSAQTPELVAPYFKLPKKKLVHVPHPSYRGTYPDHVSRLDARHELELMPDELVIVALGAIRPYKGLDELLDAWAGVPTDRPRRLVIAGAPSNEESVESLLERAAIEPGVLLDARQIPADELQLFLRAADAAVFPYRRALNSGALLLALTFGLPVIVPEGGGLAEAVEPAFSRTFKNGDQASLTAALTDASKLANPKARAAAAEAAARLDPTELARRFAKDLRARLDGAA